MLLGFFYMSLEEVLFWSKARLIFHWQLHPQTFHTTVITGLPLTKQCHFVNASFKNCPDSLLHDEEKLGEVNYSITRRKSPNQFRGTEKWHELFTSLGNTLFQESLEQMQELSRQVIPVVNFFKKISLQTERLDSPQMYVACLNLLASTSALPHLNNQHLTSLWEDRENANDGLYGKKLYKHSPAPTVGKCSLCHWLQQNHNHTSYAQFTSP